MLFYNIDSRLPESFVKTTTAELIANQEHIETADRALQAIAHPLRLKILCVIGSEEACVQDIVDAVGTSQSNISQHLAILRDKGVEFQAVIGGTGEEEVELKKQAARLDLENIISFPGWVSDARSFLKTIDIFCLPSRHEPFGIVLLEAMASKLPIIATDSEGPREILGPNGCGVIVPKNNPLALAEALNTMLEDEFIAREMARVAYDTLKGRYSMEFVSQRIDLVLREILSRTTIPTPEPLDS